MLKSVKKAFQGRRSRESENKNPYVTPELHEELLAKKAAVDERRSEFWKTLSSAEQQKRQSELDMRISQNRPMHFKWVPETDGVTVGFPMFVIHITLHDMLPLACDQLLTEEVLLAGLKCNAVSPGRFVQIGEHRGFMEVQPRWVEEFGEPE